ncbi:hypothetical protein K502DRAFT_322717 [Neoconidiobolus thromboides FSU 785]|nr:hypothetical protein K502DRAFT_322717 [Neoconidiobolus thromboides FSU 785]
MNQLFKRCAGQVKVNVSNEIIFFGCPEEANPVSLYGQVEIPHHLLRDLSSRCVLLRLNGYAKVFWDEECSYFAIMASRKRLVWQEQTLVISSDVTVHDSQLNLEASSNDTNRDYHHSFPFHFTVEGHLPSSFGHFNDCISYSVDLVILYDSFNSNGQLENKEEVIASRPFLVRRCILPTMLPSLLTGSNNTAYSENTSTRSSSPDLVETYTHPNPTIPTNFITSPHLQPMLGDPSLSEKWVGVFEGISYCVVTPSCMIMGDNELSFKLLLSNKGSPSTTCAYLSASLKQTVYCQISEGESELISGRMFSKTQPITISKTNSNQKIGLDVKQETALQVRLPLSDKLFEDLDCELIRVSHHIKLKLKFSRFSKRKLELNFPITVTSLQDLPPPYEL